jgi:hypothetical protein
MIGKSHLLQEQILEIESRSNDPEYAKDFDVAYAKVNL